MSEVFVSNVWHFNIAN